MRYHIFAFIIAIACVGLWYGWCADRVEAPVGTPTASSVVLQPLPDVRNLRFTIDGTEVSLVEGSAASYRGPDAAIVQYTRYFGNDVVGDLNGDGIDDVAFLVTVDGGGSGTFFYVVAAVSTSDGYIGTNAALLGDRIAPQTTEIRDGVLVVNYADRQSGAAMATLPTIGVTDRFVVRGSTLDVVRD